MTVVGPAGRPDQPPASILDDLRDIAPMVAGTRLRVTGLHFGSSTVFARIEASGGDLVGARRVLRGRWGTPGSTGIEAVFRDRLMWTTIVRCTAPADAGVHRGGRAPTPDPERLVRDRGHRAARSNRVMAAGRDGLAGHRSDPRPNCLKG